jgi:natural product biosynthesis luciferase-like monooxygenase protein
MFRDIKTIQSLWRGETIELPNGVGKLIEVGVYPRPIQPELPIWITSQSSETFVKAGEIGANVLTNFNYKRSQDLSDRIELYRTSLKMSGHDQAKGKVTLMMHTFLAESMEKVEEKVRPAYNRYLTTNMTLQSNQASNFKVNLELSQDDKDVLISNAYDRLVSTHGLVGTVKSCYEKVKLLKMIGVDEIACLIDFGIDYDSAMQSLAYLNRLKDLAKVSDSTTV